jgi:tripartite-type tricarboxylate transporter receptor subunit TctC
MKRLLLALALATSAVLGANAQSYPTRSVTLIVPFAAGGPADITGRMAADIFSRALGQQFVVENVVGGGGATGVTRAARAAPDGYTLTLGHMGTHAAAVAVNPNLSYKPEEDFEPIGLVAEYPIVLVVRKGFPAKSLREFVDYAKANEAKLNMAHAGIGSVSHTTCLLLNAAIGIKPTMVPFTGTAPALNALIGEQVDYVCDPISGPLGHIRAGTLQGMAIAVAKRHPALPDVPTATEGGLPGFAAAPFYGIFAPKGTPQPVIDQLAAALAAGLDEETVNKRTIELGGAVPEKQRRGAKVLAEVVKSEIARLTPILKAATK